ncbi:multicopper oxidase family protein [uncultured Roseibium sp.]|uniref:multicopper oxidase family protein n=1 Tax=uncultured Roseibium sp. TaxID=1936171 RepID=UPI002635B758|nr:multicopper oxidase family protein [uncultured Roseibium sp.]
MDRRTFLKSALAGSVTTAFPQLALAEASAGFLELTAVQGQANLYGDNSAASDLWLYNHQLPGPEIRVKQGDRVKVRFTNKLSEPTSVHWHGIRIENAMDGVAGLTQPAVQPGESFDYDFVAPDAGTYWYHAHNMSWNQVPRGLAGPLIVEDHGQYFSAETDIILMLSDWRLNDEGVLDTGSFGAMHDFSHAGRLGNWLTVNGASLPDIPLKMGHWHRLRLINTSSARILEIAPDRFGAKVIALDGQSFNEAREVAGVVQLAPAQRIDLALRPPEAGTLPFEMMTGQPFTFANFQVAEAPANDRPLSLPPVNRLPEPDLEDALEIPLVMEGGAMGGMRSLLKERSEDEVREMMQNGLFWTFNGVPGVQDEPMFNARRGETIVLESRNDTSFAHAMHVHGHHFRVLERNGEPLEHQDWRDTFTTAPREIVKIAFVADNPGKWLIHCHMLGHAASGMRTWFEVV